MPDERIAITIRTADGTKKAEVKLAPSMTVASLITECQKRWALPTPPDWALMDRSRSQQLLAKQTLAEAGVADGATLEMQHLSDAGVPQRPAGIATAARGGGKC